MKCINNNHIVKRKKQLQIVTCMLYYRQKYLNLVEIVVTKCNNLSKKEG